MATIFDDRMRDVIAWKLCTIMKADDVADTLTLALTASGCNQTHVIHKPAVLSDNGSSCIASDLADRLRDRGTDHVRGVPLHPRTQGSFEHSH